MVAVRAGVVVALVLVAACHDPPPGGGAATTIPEELKTLYCTTAELPDLEYAPGEGFRAPTALGMPVEGCLGKLVQAGVFTETATHTRCGARRGPLAECVSLVDVHVLKPAFDGGRMRARVRGEDGVLKSGGPAIPCYEAGAVSGSRLTVRATDLGKRVLATCGAEAIWVLDAKGAPALKPPGDEVALPRARAPAKVALYDLAAPVAGDAGAESGNGEFASGSLRALFKATRASSFIDNKTERHPPDDAFDGNPATAWSEGAPGPGKGEWIEVEFERAVEIEALEMATGFNHKTDLDEDLFPLNARFKRVRVELLSEGGGGDPIEQDVAEDQRTLRVELGWRRATRLRIVAADVYRGKKWQDLSLSEATVLGRVAK